MTQYLVYPFLYDKNRSLYTHKFIVVYAFEENFAVVLPGFAFHYFITTFWAWNEGDPARAKWIQRKGSCWDERRTRQSLTHIWRRGSGGILERTRRGSGGVLARTRRGSGGVLARTRRGGGSGLARTRQRPSAEAMAGKERAEEVGCCRPSAASAAVEQFPLFVFVSSLGTGEREKASVMHQGGAKRVGKFAMVKKN